jgi:hypothetical protein
MRALAHAADAVRLARIDGTASRDINGKPPSGSPPSPPACWLFCTFFEVARFCIASSAKTGAHMGFDGLVEHIPGKTRGLKNWKSQQPCAMALKT